jgi:hypothetical protein
LITDQLPSVGFNTYRKGNVHVGVWAIQHALGITADGAFGPLTEQAVKAFQYERGLAADGVVGGFTQRELVEQACLGAYATHRVPEGILESVSQGEAGYNPGAINASAPGGKDVGAFQRRVYDGQGRTYIERALRINYQARLLAGALRERHNTFRARGHLTNEESWRCAVLAHNWPYGADRLSRGYALSDKTATWVPSSVKFKDGAPVVTYADWADWYSMGSPEHNHEGRMVSLVTAWTL